MLIMLNNCLKLEQRAGSLAKVIIRYAEDHPGSEFNFLAMSKPQIARMIDELTENKYQLREVYECISPARCPIEIGNSCSKEFSEDIQKSKYKVEYNEVRFGRKIIVKQYKGNYIHAGTSYHLDEDPIVSGYLTIEKMEFNDPEYLADKEKYLEAMDIYNKHPELYDHAPTFDFKYHFWLTFTERGYQLIKWFES